MVNHDAHRGGYGGRGCNWIGRPAHGSSSAKARLEYWCDLFSSVTCSSDVTIESPLGMQWHYTRQYYCSAGPSLRMNKAKFKHQIGFLVCCIDILLSWGANNPVST